MTLRIGSVCSGIGGAELAFAGLEVEHVFMSEIDPFARAVLTHRFPDIPLHGDFRTIERDTYGTIDLLVGGTPCQSFSIAGLRGGLADDRGNLALEFLRLADRLRPRWLLWENVPGVRSSNGGRDFASFLAGLDELGYSACWRSFDAQYAGLAQRRERVFLVGYLGDWRPAAAVLSLAEGLRWDPAPRREAGQGAARPLASCPEGGSGYRNDADTADNLIAPCIPASGRGYARAGDTRGQDALAVVAAFDARQSDVCQYGDLAGALDTDGYSMAVNVPEISHARNAHRSTRYDPSGETYLVTTLAVRGRENGAELEWREDGLANAVLTPSGGRAGIGVGAIAHTLRAEGFDASEDGTGRGPPLVVTPLNSDATRSGVATTPSRDATGYVRLRDPSLGVGESGDPMFTLQAGAPHAVGYTLLGSSKTVSTARETETHAALRARTPGTMENSTTTIATVGSVVRRLTPVECERLMGVPDNFTAVPYRGKIAADGPRYRALGNSWAVPVVRWIAERLVAQHAAIDTDARRR